MSTKQKAFLYGVVSVLGNIITLGIVPAEYKLWAVLVFNIVQSTYAFFDQSYALKNLGRGK